MNLKKDFPIFEKHKKLVYLDSASTSQKPKVVVNTIKNFYEKENANIHRGIYPLSEQATKAYEDSRKTVAKFVNADPKEIVFTASITSAINSLAYVLPGLFVDKNEIVISEMEHHSNLVPWQQMAKLYGCKLKIIKMNSSYEIDINDAKKKITKKTGIVAINCVSNTLGAINDVKKIIRIAKRNKALTIIDAAQAVPHIKIDVKKLDCDFLTFSGHKLYGPMGIGVLYGKYKILEKIPPFNFGGDMVDYVSLEKTSFAKPPRKFEAGTQNVASAIALGEAIKYINKIGLKNIQNQEKKLLEYTYKKLKMLKGITIYMPKNNIGIISFNLNGIHSHDVAQILADNNIAIRAGHHCTMPLMKRLGIPGTARISIAMYNTKEDIDKLVSALKQCQEVFR